LNLEETQGRDPKKSRNLIAVLCCFCEWFDFGVCADSGIGVMELQVAADATMESLVLAILRLFSPCRDDMK
jgi:hypothetical protein